VQVDPYRDLQNAAIECQRLCKKKASSRNWDIGPCISNDIRVSDGEPYGCDIAHCPRINVDNDKSNQCNRSKWIELDTHCGWLRYRKDRNEPRQGVKCTNDGSNLLLN